MGHGAFVLSHPFRRERGKDGHGAFVLFALFPGAWCSSRPPFVTGMVHFRLGNYFSSSWEEGLSSI